MFAKIVARICAELATFVVNTEFQKILIQQVGNNNRSPTAVFRWYKERTFLTSPRTRSNARGADLVLSNVQACLLQFSPLPTHEG